MNAARHFQPAARRPFRLASGLLGAVVGLGIVVSVIQSMGAQSGGQSLGQFVATQRAIAQQPMARATVPSAAEVPRSGLARDAV